MNYDDKQYSQYLKNGESAPVELSNEVEIMIYNIPANIF